jgi:hypothetical protein
MNEISEISYMREYWTGDSRDGHLLNGDGYHYYRMKKELIVEAYEMYEADDGTEIVSPLPEMMNVDWFKDLGFEDKETLEVVTENEFNRIKSLHAKQ